MRFNGWHRSGIVLSIVWVLGVGIYQRNAELKRANEAVSSMFAMCVETHLLSADKKSTDCLQETEKNRMIWLEGSWGNVAWLAFLPVLLAWSAVFLLVRVWRWVRAGFNGVE